MKRRHIFCGEGTLSAIFATMFLLYSTASWSFPVDPFATYVVEGSTYWSGSRNFVSDTTTALRLKLDAARISFDGVTRRAVRPVNPLETFLSLTNGSNSLAGYYYYRSEEFPAVKEMHDTESLYDKYLFAQAVHSETEPQEVEIPFRVSQTDQKLIIVINGRRRFYSMTVLDGSGQVYEPDQTVATDYNNFLSFDNIAAGEWKLRLRLFGQLFVRAAVQGGPDITPLTDINTPTRIFYLVEVDSNLLDEGEEGVLRLASADSEKIVRLRAVGGHFNANPICQIFDITDTEGFSQPKIAEIPLFDDGLHQDGTAQDGIFGNTVQLTYEHTYIFKYGVEEQDGFQRVAYQIFVNEHVAPQISQFLPEGIIFDPAPNIRFQLYTYQDQIGLLEEIELEEPKINSLRKILLDVDIDGVPANPTLTFEAMGSGVVKITGTVRPTSPLSTGSHNASIGCQNFFGRGGGDIISFTIKDRDMPDPLTITEFSIEGNWVEIRANASVDLSADIYISGLNNYLEKIVQDPLIIQPGEFAVIHFEDGVSDQESIDNNGNGIKDIFIGKRPMKSTDDQIVILIFNPVSDTVFTSAGFLKGNPHFLAVDAVVYSNNDGEINGRIDNERFFSEELVRVDQWKMADVDFTQADAVSLPKSQFSSVGRKVGSTDNNSKDDWEEFVIPTPGGPNVKLTPAKKGDILITEFSVEGNKYGDWVELEVKNGPADLRGVVITQLESNSFFRLVPTSSPEMLVNPGQRILVHFVLGENETLGNDLNGNGALDIHFGPFNLIGNDNQIVVMFGSEILDAVQYVRIDGRLMDDRKDIKRLVNFGHWQISGPNYTENDGVELPGSLYSLGRKVGEPDSDRKEDWVVMLRTTPGKENVFKDIPPEGAVLVNEVRINNIFGKEEDWAELYNFTNEAQEIDFYVLTDLHGEERKLSSEALTIEPQSFAVIHWVTPFDERQTEIDASGDVNGNGYRDIYLVGNKLTGNALSGTDDQLVLSAGKQIIDAVSWSNGDGLMTERELRDNQLLLANGAWIGTFTDRSDQSSAVILENQFFPIARLPNGFDSNKNTDWKVAEATQGAENENFTEDKIPPVTTLAIRPRSVFVGDSRYVSLSHQFNLIPKDDFTTFTEVFFNLPEFGDQFVSILGPFFLTREGENRIRYFSVDAAGNKEEIREAFVTVDAVHPVSRSELTNNRLKIIATDTGGGGVGEVNLSVDGGQFLQVYPDTAVVFDQPDTHVIVFFSKDRVGNEEPAHTETIFVRIMADAEPPFFVRFSPSGGEAYVAKRDTIVISLEAKDSVDPDPTVFAQLVHFVGSVSDTAITVFDSQQIAPLSIPSGQWKLVATAKDAAGNIRTQEGGFFTVIHDALAPRTTLIVGDPKFVRISDGAIYITAATPLAFSAVDDLVSVGDSAGLGVARIEAAVNGVAFTAVTGPLALTGLGEGKHTVSYRATDVVGNIEATRTTTLYIDASAPVTTDTKTPDVNKNGWNATDVTVSLSAVDPVLSDSSNSGSGVKETRLGVNGSTPAPYTSATTLSAEGIYSLVFFSPDNIGNTEAIKSDTVRIDKTVPVVNSNRAPLENRNNWNRDPVFVSYTATDTLSGVDTSISDLVMDVLSAEAAGQSTSAFAVDLAGNTTTVSVTNINIDSTPPVVTTSRTPPNLNGWNNFTVTVIFAETDALSGIDTPASDVTLATEGFGQSAPGVSVDLAGNTTTVTVPGINIDLTNPVVTGIASPSANVHVWRNTPVSVTFDETDALSGIDTPAIDVTLINEGAGQTTGGFAVDIAGNTGTVAVADINIDLTSPVLTVSRAPDANTNAWNNSTVTVNYTATDTLSGIDGSLTDTQTDILSAEGPGQTAGAIAVDKAGNASTVSVTDINIDLSAPVVTATQAPDANVHGWNNTSVTVTYADTDTLSGVDTANSDVAADVLNTEGAGQSTSGFAVDLAGNTGTATVSNINIDFTAPTIALQSITPDSTGLGIDGRSWWKTPVNITFTADDILSSLATTQLTFTLPNEGKDQGVTGIAVDKADNTSTLTVGGINIDLTAPNVSLQIGTPQVEQTYIKSTTPLTINGADTLSGMKAISVATTPSGLFAISGQTADVVSGTLSAEGQIALTFSGTDIATNKSGDQSASFIVDNTAPSTSISIDITDTTGLVLIPQSEITLAAIDGPALTPAVGVDRIEYEINGGATQTYSGPFSVSGIGLHTLTYLAIDRLGTAEATNTFNFTVSPALSANKAVSFAPRVLVWLNDKSGEKDDDDDDEDKGIPDANVAVINSILDSAQILLYDVVTEEDSFVSFMRTDSYNVYVILGDDDKLEKEREWELSERVRMGDGLISSVMDEIELPTKDKGEGSDKESEDDKDKGESDDDKSGDEDEKDKSGDKDDKGKSEDDDSGKGKSEDEDSDEDDSEDSDDDEKSGKASKNLLGVDVSGEHSDKGIEVTLTGLAIPYTGDYQTTDKTQRVRELAATAVGDGFITPDGKDKEPEPSVVGNVFGSGKTVFFAFDVGISATPGNSGPTGDLLNAAIKKVTPTKEVFIPDGRTAIGIGVQSKVVPLNLAVRIEEIIPAGASVVNKLDGDVQRNTIIWNLSLDVNEADTVQYVLGLPDQGEASVTTNADVSYIVRGNYILFDTLKLTIITEKDLPNLLDQAIAQLSALNPADKDDQNKVEDAVDDLQKQKSSPPTTDKQIEDAIEDVLEIIRDLDSVEADAQKVPDIRDTLDKVVLVYGRKLSQ